MEVKTMEDAVRIYRKVEASLDEKKAKYEADTEKERRGLEQLQVIMRAMLNQAGVGSMNLPGMAEVKLTPKRTFGCADWDMLMTWARETDTIEIFQKKIHEANMQHWIDTHPGEPLPPGVTVYSELILKVLKAK